MKMILLMSSALCFGMSGYGTEETVTGADGLGSGSGNARLYEKRKTSMGAPLNAMEDSLPTKKAKIENSPEIEDSPTRITEVPTSPQRGFSVQWTKEDWELFKLHNQLLQEASKELELLLNSKVEWTVDSLKKIIKEIIENCQLKNPEEEKIMLIYQCIDSCLRRKLDCRSSSTRAAAQKIFDLLDKLPPESFSLKTHTED